jgi:hypothetical protein
VSANASDNVGVTFVDFFATPIGAGPPTPIFIGSDTTAPYSVSWTPPDNAFCVSVVYNLTSEAHDACLNKGVSTPIPITVFDFTCSGVPRQAVWASQLDVPGGAGRVSLNGAAVAVGRGRVQASARLPRGESRVDAELVDGEGKPGLWRFELGTYVAPGSVRVLAGEVLQVSDMTVVFRLAGKPGERVSFSFRTLD